MKKVIFFIILLSFILIFLPGIAGAWEETLEGHWWDEPQSKYTLTSVSTHSFQNGTAFYETTTAWASIKFTENYTGYLMFTMYPSSKNGYIHVYFNAAGAAHVYTCDPTGAIVPKDQTNVIEFIQSADKSLITMYLNGNVVNTYSKLGSADVITIDIQPSTDTGGAVYIDNIASSPYVIADSGFYSTATSNAYFTATVPSTPGYSYYMQISSSSGASIKQFQLSSRNMQYSISPATDLAIDGIYYAEIYGQDGVLYYSKPFIYFANGVYPPVYFLAETDTSANIRDENNNGGTVTGGGTVYLYPSLKANGNYNISCNFLEPTYSRELVYTKIYNTSILSGSIFSFSGMQGNSYNISLNNVLQGHSLGADTWSYIANWVGVTAYTIDFTPDYSLPGVWGYVKDSTSQQGIKSAKVIIYNSTFSTTIYTDVNGMYYYASGITPGTSYTVSVSKAGYAATPQQTIVPQTGLTTRLDFYLDSTSSIQNGEGLYYATHDVSFTVLPYWYSHIGVPGAEYSVKDSNGTIKATGYTDTKGKFAIENMQAGTNYSFEIRYNGSNHTEYIMPSETQYNIVLNNQEIIHEYYNSWLTLNYTENNRSVAIAYASNKSIAGATAVLKYNNGTIADTKNLNTQTGSFIWNSLPAGDDYLISFNITASDNEKASQSWALSAYQKVTLFPDSYPSWLKNTLFVAIILIFMLAFGKSKNDIACLSAAVLTSLGQYFGWLTCSYYFVILVWIIALSAAYLHYKRTGALG